MKNQVKSNKKVIIGVVIALVLIIGGYWMFSGGSAPADTDSLLSPVASGDGSVANVGSDLLPFLLEINSLHLDNTIFSDKTFLSLQDNTIELAPQPVGRNNPFAAVNRSDSANFSTTTTTTKLSAIKLPTKSTVKK